ncbi:MAG: cysteine desulfurase family protein [candidate division WOR-3 bacterium]
MIYLDNNATTKPAPEAIDAVLKYMNERWFNPSSPYAPAEEAKRDLEEFRATVAGLLSCEPEEIIFTSGGTESDNAAIKGYAFANMDKGKHIITSQIEHKAVLGPLRWLENAMGFEITHLPVDSRGIVILEELERAIRPDTILVSVMSANNETGVIQPIEEIVRIAHEKGVAVHTDAVQSVGKVPVDIKSWGVDLLSASGHKFHGPRGVGFLFKRKGLKITALIQGGGHERKMRSGTENLAGIAGMTKALEIAVSGLHEYQAKVSALRDALERGITERIPEVIVNGAGAPRVPNTLSVSVKYVEGESMLLWLSDEGIYVSSGSACTSGSLEPSHVLLAMGLDHATAHGSLRFSFSRYNTMEDVERVLEVLPGVVERLRAISPFGKK